jgi:hypothetical protein
MLTLDSQDEPQPNSHMTLQLAQWHSPTRSRPTLKPSVVWNLDSDHFTSISRMDAVEHGLVYSTSHDVHKGTLTHTYTPTDSKMYLTKISVKSTG